MRRALPRSSSALPAQLARIVVGQAHQLREVAHRVDRAAGISLVSRGLVLRGLHAERERLRESVVGRVDRRRVVEPLELDAREQGHRPPDATAAPSVDVLARTDGTMAA